MSVDHSATAYKKICWRLMPFLIICYFIASIDRGNVAYAKLQFTEQLGFTSAIYGIGAGIFFLGYILFEIPSNLLLKRIGIRRTLLRIMVTWGVLCALLALMTLPWHYFTLRFFLGVAEAGFFPGVMYYITKWATPSQRGQLIAIFMASIGLSGSLAGPIAGYILSHLDGFMGMHGWQWLFIIEGMPAVFLGIAAYFYLDESPKDAKWLTSEEKDSIQSAMDAEASNAAVKGGSIKSLFVKKEFYALCILGAGLMSGTAAVMFWIPTIFREAGITDYVKIGLYSSIPFLFAVVAQFLNARSSDKRQERFFHASLPICVAAIGWIAMATLADSVMGYAICMAVATLGIFAAMGPFWAMPSMYLNLENRAAGIAIISTIGGVASFVQPIAVGFLNDASGNLTGGFFYNGTFLAVSAISFLVLLNSRGKSS